MAWQFISRWHSGIETRVIARQSSIEKPHYSNLSDLNITITILRNIKRTSQFDSCLFPEIVSEWCHRIPRKVVIETDDRIRQVAVFQNTSSFDLVRPEVGKALCDDAALGTPSRIRIRSQSLGLRFQLFGTTNHVFLGSCRSAQTRTKYVHTYERYRIVCTSVQG